MKIRRKFGLGFAIGLLALAFAALPALAQAANVSLREGSSGGAKLTVGAGVEALSGNLVFVTSIGNLERKESVVTGEVTANSAEPARVKVKTASFEGLGGGVCETSIPGGVTAEITPASLPWEIQFFANGTTKIIGPAFGATLRNSKGETVAVCSYSAAEIADTFNFKTALVDTITGQTLTGGGTSLCPSSGTLTGEFEVGHNHTVVVATTP